MFLPTWAIAIILLLIVSMFFMVINLFARLRRLRRLVKKIEDPDYEERFDTGDVEGR
ncbi:MAG TPA: hypothetical protein VJB92_01785 [Candidatus Paceibacterota bacterium]